MLCHLYWVSQPQYSECHNTACRYARCRFAECRCTPVTKAINRTLCSAALLSNKNTIVSARPLLNCSKNTSKVFPENIKLFVGDERSRLPHSKWKNTKKSLKHQALFMTFYWKNIRGQFSMFTNFTECKKAFRKNQFKRKNRKKQNNNHGNQLNKLLVELIRLFNN